jgi:hypothetical protein
MIWWRTSASREVVDGPPGHAETRGHTRFGDSEPVAGLGVA